MQIEPQLTSLVSFLTLKDDRGLLRFENHEQLFEEMDPKDQIHHDAVIDFLTSPSFSTSENQSNQELYSMASLSNDSHFLLGDEVAAAGDDVYNHEKWTPVVVAPPQPVVPVISSGFDEVSCPLSAITPPVPLPPSYAISSNSSLTVNPMIAPCIPVTTQFSLENHGIFAGISGALMLGDDIISHQDLDFKGERGVPFLPHDPMQRYLNCTSDLLIQALRTKAPLSSEINTSFEDPSFKATKLSMEERRRKVDRYRNKKNERNFSKKIKYACRKTLADSRPRVRGRFAKNDELLDEDIRMFKAKEEDDATYGSDIFSHLTDVNSLKCNYPINLGVELD